MLKGTSQNPCHPERSSTQGKLREGSQSGFFGLRPQNDGFVSGFKSLLSKLSDFDYRLPKAQIAQFALSDRATARLMILHRSSASIVHCSFRQIVDYFSRGDVLVLNDTKVLPARLFARRKTGARVEMLVLGCRGGPCARPFSDERPAFYDAGAHKGRPYESTPTDNGGDTGNICRVLIKPCGRVRKDEELILNGEPKTTVRVLDAPDHETGIRHVEFQTEEDLQSLLYRIGRIPLPPYIDREDTSVDREMYQTVFAAKPGAVASPTAGLHFDHELLRQLEAKGVEIVYVTLHVSYGTFQPVQSEDLTQHQMYVEDYEVSREAAETINFAKGNGRPVVACGTTVVRALESAAIDSIPSVVEGRSGKTDLFIYPPYQFKIADHLITNFHLPKSTLLMLTSAFAGHGLLMHAYREAIENKYRFYSYGDAMLIR
ncbi:MAG: tRNA preQ1(34) S-adenosylmethionine ribosyltransferase-isomerase QueA [Omnitrophica bacterium RIFCSPLOWO2_12_FULL_50_11]|nr:MAG: tRNA preQ1(34) S-adenosylmethionine ribosyltransferase-isomerase QueA [Omnitrophica bacterium RIFCSPLOWO2_12_FULL_50_11]